MNAIIWIFLFVIDDEVTSNPQAKEEDECLMCCYDCDGVCDCNDENSQKNVAPCFLM